VAEVPYYAIKDIPTKRAIQALDAEVVAVGRKLTAMTTRNGVKVNQFGLDKVPTQGSDNAVSSGGVFQKIADTASGLSTQINQNAVKSSRQTFSEFAVAASLGTTMTVAVPTGATYIYDVILRYAWPRNNWNNGAIVAISNKDNALGSVGSKTSLNISLTTTSAQNYNIVIGVLYR
jgi:hypothetical protein